MKQIVINAIEAFFINLAEQAVNLFLSFVASINGIAAYVLDMPIVVQGILYAQSLAGTILAAKVAYEAWMVHILRQAGDPDADPGGLLVRTAMSAAMIGGSPWLVRWLYKFGTEIATDVSQLPGITYATMGGQLDLFFSAIFEAGSFILFACIAILFALIILIVVLIQTFIRAAELAVVAVVGSFMALGLTSSDSQTFSTWWKELLNLSMAQAIQLFLLKLSFITLTLYAFGDNIIFNLFLFCGFLWVTVKSPSILKQYIYSSGLGRVAGGMASSAASMAVMRRFMSRGIR